MTHVHILSTRIYISLPVTMFKNEQGGRHSHSKRSRGQHHQSASSRRQDKMLSFSLTHLKIRELPL